MRHIQSSGVTINGGMIPSLIVWNRDRLQQTITASGRCCHRDSTQAQDKQCSKTFHWLSPSRLTSDAKNSTIPEIMGVSYCSSPDSHNVRLGLRSLAAARRFDHDIERQESLALQLHLFPRDQHVVTIR